MGSVRSIGLGGGCDSVCGLAERLGGRDMLSDIEIEEQIRTAVESECGGCEHGRESVEGCTWMRDTGNVGWDEHSVVRPPCMPKRRKYQ